MIFDSNAQDAAAFFASPPDHTTSAKIPHHRDLISSNLVSRNLGYKYPDDSEAKEWSIVFQYPEMIRTVSLPKSGRNYNWAAQKNSS
jgi:hypothetical protein